MKHLTPFFISIRNNVAAFVLFLALWGVSSVFFPPYIVPSPLQVLLEFGMYWHTEFLQHLGMTLYRCQWDSCSHLAWERRSVSLLRDCTRGRT